MNEAPRLPHWDMSVVYPGLDSPEFIADFEAAKGQIDDLFAFFNRYQIEKNGIGNTHPEFITAFEAVIATSNTVFEHLQTIGTYIYSFFTTDSYNPTAQKRVSELQQLSVRLAQAQARMTAWIGTIDVADLQARSDVARVYEYFLNHIKQQSLHQMSPAEEELAAEMSSAGGQAWGAFHSDLTSQLLVPFEVDGKTESLPMSAIRNLSSDPDREVRRRAYEAELAAWKTVAMPSAASLNGVKGETGLLAKRRGWSSPLEASLFDNNIDQETLSAMMDATTAAFPEFRRYLKAKARYFGDEHLKWYDLFAPVGKSERSWSYDDAQTFLIKTFGSFSPRLSGLAERAFTEQWIDAEPRAGKVGGAFCAPLRNGESRVLANFQPAIDSVLTLAHELGHAYHNFNLANQPMLNRDTPMTLAETASIFCETIVRHAAMKDAPPSEQLEILEAFLQNACQVTVDITSRFQFEQAVFNARSKRRLTVEEFSEFMLDSQRATYGDGLDMECLHPYMWAVKPHYYTPGYSFYNYPYMFGLLFGLGLYAIYQREPETFLTGYDNLLSSTGLADAATLAAQMGINIRSSAFWQGSLEVIRRDIDLFEELIAKSSQ